MKRIVICMDGTWNTPDDQKNPTNVVKIMRAIVPIAPDGTHQTMFYDKGVGTGGPIDRIRGGAFGRGLSDNVQEGYRFLANNYLKDDGIYLFGFSRGAYTARSLAGFVGKMGIIAKVNLHLLPVLWDQYKDGVGFNELPQSIKQQMDTPCFARIRCIGVWDTVGALGIPLETFRPWNQRRYQFHNVNLGGHIDVALHAVAIDEQRGPFGPALWDRKGRDGQLVEQVWFPGVHSNVGGSYPDEGLSSLALDWMVRRVRAATGLAFDDGYLSAAVNGNALGNIYESRTTMYFLSRVMPFIRLIGQNRLPAAWWRKWIKRSNVNPSGQPNVNEMIHRCVLERFGNDAPFNGKNEVYQPKNLAAALAQDAPFPLKTVEKDGNYPGNPVRPKEGPG